jgi:hypothetical protein
MNVAIDRFTSPEFTCCRKILDTYEQVLLIEEPESKGGCMQDAQSTLPTDNVLSPAAVIPPSQYFASVGSSGLSGEQRLMLAVLVDAMNVLRSWRTSGSMCKRRNFAEAAQWVNAHGTRYPFSFDSVCDALEINPELLRSRLRLLTVGSANSTHRHALPRLRLKEVSHSRHMTINRLRRRERNSRIVTALIEQSSGLPSPWDGHFEETQDRIS